MALSTKKNNPFYSIILLLFLFSWVETSHATNHNETISAVQNEYEVDKLVGDKNNRMLGSVSQGSIGGGGGGGGVTGGGGGGGGGGGYGWGWGSNGGGGGGASGSDSSSGSGNASGGTGSVFSGSIGHGTSDSTSENDTADGCEHGRGRGNASSICSCSSDRKVMGRIRANKFITLIATIVVNL